MAQVLIVPGAAVRSYVRPAVEELCRRGHGAELLPVPGEPGCSADLGEYGRGLGMRIRARCDPVDLLIGLSVGSQVVAVAAAAQGGAGSSGIRRLMLVSPTVDASVRSMPMLLGRWIAGGRVERPRLLREQLPDWRRAGLRRVLTVARSALAVDLEHLLAVVDVPVDVVHAEHDKITSHLYAAALAAGDRRGLTVVPGATHSWPYSDAGRFADLVERVLG